MQAIISPGYIQGTVNAPPSKSMMQRVCAAALLHKGTTIIQNPGNSDDDKTALHIIQQLGAEVQATENGIRIISKGINPSCSSIDCNESGLSARLFTPIVALTNTAIQVTGKGSLLKRPMDTLLNILPELGVNVEVSNNHIPFTVYGPLQPKPIKIDGSLSSQFLSGLIFAYAYAAKEPLTIEVTDLKSKPYIDMTLDVLRQFGRPITHTNYETFYISPERFNTQEEINITIEGDWSSAASIFTAGAIAGNVTMAGLDINSKQADKTILEVLKLAGVHIHIQPGEVHVKKATPLYPFEFDATDCPDLFPMLAVLAACCNGESSITGVHRLFYKESNRLASIGDMLQAFGIFFSVEDDTLVIEGMNGTEYATVDSYNDHRIVMAAAAGSLRASGPVVITDAEAISKSYPDFFAVLSSLGATVLIQNQ